MGKHIIRRSIDMKNAVMDNKVLTILLSMMLLTAVAGLKAGALDVDYVGAITEGFHAPTSIVASEDAVAVLDPYAETISIFLPDGLITRRIHLNGDAHSLTRIDEQTYAYCDRSRKTVVAYDIAADRQYDYVEEQSSLNDPVDLIYDGLYLHVLDAGNSAIYIYDGTRSLRSVITLTDDSGTALRFASSFVYDKQGKLYFVMDQTKSRICRFADDGQYRGSLADFGSGDGQITRGGEIELTGSGLILVTDRYQGRVGIFDHEGTYFGHFGVGQEGEPHLSIPTGINVDENGLIYVVSTMGAYITVYHLPPVIDETALLTAVQQYPDDGSEIVGNDIALEAFVEAYQAADRVTGFEFQIFDDGSSLEPVDASPEVAPDSHFDLQEGRQRVMARWTPEMTFEDNTYYNWRSRVHTVDTVGGWTAMRSFSIIALPKHFRLDQNAPNPFNPETRISFTLAAERDVTLEVINLLGQKIRVLVAGRLPTGEYQVTWDGMDDETQQAASGIYFYRLRAGDFVQTRKMVLLR
jgi:hypothetical protein